MVFKKNKRQNIVVSAFTLLAFASGIFFLTPSFAHAASFWDIFTTNPFKWLLYGLFWVCGLIASMAITLFEWAVNPDYTSGSGGLLNRASVYTMWQFVRDFFNLFFILTLLYTAFTIVFQVASNYKKTLLSIVLAALFVNFSFPITRVIIDVTNVPMYYFVNQIGSTGENKEILGTVLSASKIQGILIPGSESGIGDVNIKEMGVSQLLMAIIFLFIFSITLLVLAILFVIRLIALVVLLIFSSVGFAASVIPGLGKYGSMWWDKLWQYTFFGPAAMLMLFVATTFFAEIAQDNTKAQFVESAIANVASSEAGFVSSMAMFTVPIIMLWMAIGLATSMSIMGAGAVAGTGQKFAKWAGRKATVSPVMFAGRKLDSKLAGSKNFSFLSPGAWKLAIKQRSEEQKHNDEQPIKLAAATRQDQLNNAISRFSNTIVPTNWLPKNWDKLGRNTDHTDHRFAERQSQKAGHVKEITEVSDRSDVVIEHLEAAIAGQDAAKAEAAISILAKNNDLNDLIVGHGHKYGGTNEVSSDNLKVILDNILKKTGVQKEEDIAKTLMVLSDQALASGNYAFGGMSNYDSTTGVFSVSTAAQQAGQVAAKFNNLEPQKQATMLHPDTLFKRDASGFTDMNDDVAVAIIGKIAKGTADQSNRSRADMRSALQNAYEQVTLHGSTAFPKFQANYNGNANFRYYVGKMLEQNGALPPGVTTATAMPTAI